MARRYKKTSEVFVNPYHFVPLGSVCNKSHNYREIRERTGLMTGWIECSLETVTPVFVPNTTSDNTFSSDSSTTGRKSYDFYSREDLGGKQNPEPPERPSIPGSELRGMIRSAFEAVTSSCMSTAPEDHTLFKRVSNAAKGYGRLQKKDGHWILIRCTRYGVGFRRTSGDTAPCRDEVETLTEGMRYWIKPSGSFYKKPTRTGTMPLFPVVGAVSPTKPDNDDEWLQGYFHRGERFDDGHGNDRRHHESFFVESESKPIDVDKICVRNLLANFELYRDAAVNRHKKSGKHGGYKHISADTTADLDGALVYYSEHQSENGNRYYLSPAAIGREVFYNELRDLLGSFTPCDRLDELCPCCALFGMVSEHEAAASRLRFSDAVFTQSNEGNCPVFLNPMVVPELASPKPSATEFYLTKGGINRVAADLWNYDYAGKWGEPEENQDRNKFYDVGDYKPEIRGRKFYWHGTGNVRNVEQESQPLAGEKIEVSDRHVKIRPLAKNNVFSFTIHFNQITEEELKRLLWVLSVGGSGKHGHKLGMGKPVGLGSVIVRPKSVYIRRLELSNSQLDYCIDEKNDFIDKAKTESWLQACALLGGEKNVVNAFLAITALGHDFRGLIDYPGLDWFVQNKLTRGTGMRQKIDQQLPLIDNPKLNKIIVDSDTSRPYSRNR